MIAPFGIRPKGTLLARMLPLAQALTRRGHAVSIVAPPVQNAEDAATRVVYSDVPVIHVGRARLPGALDWSVALAQAARHERPDLLHLFKPKGFGGLAALLAQVVAPQVPLVVDTDDWEGWGGWNDLLPYPRVAKSVFAWQEADLPRRAAAVTVASRTLQTQVWGLGIDPQRVFYVPNGWAPNNERYIPAQTPLHPTILLYTRFWEFAMGGLIAALVAIVQQEPNVRLLVIGKGERGEERTMMQLAARAGVASHIDYRGWVEPEVIPSLLAAASVAIVPLNDTLINRARCSAKLLELMNAGLAVVAADVGEMRSYIRHEQSGLLVTPGDPGALAKATVKLLRDDKLRARLVQGAHTALASFSWDELAVPVEQAYTLALG